MLIVLRRLFTSRVSKMLILEISLMKLRIILVRLVLIFDGVFLNGSIS